MSLSPAARMAVSGAALGSLYVAEGAVFEVKPQGKLYGSLQVDGSLSNEGIRGGPWSGAGELLDLPGSQVARPVMRDGDPTYIV